MNDDANITLLLQDYEKGNREALDAVFPLVYEELRRLAANRLRDERCDHTLQPTALVHEAYLRLTEQYSTNWRSRAHFFGLAAEMMRRILVNHALGKNRVKRFGNQTRLALDDAVSFAQKQEIDVVALDEALDKLAEFDKVQAKIIELKFFAGLTNEEIAEVLSVSDSTVKREWRIAKAWLYERMKDKG
ncbi:MAG: sigma-70 family RNA polymerase sigma factor [Acidobacteria bacterium]|jgi:RNA polymerase sigma factor (TIGR02999 family)|nr:sigma-70 family RNA polymerase sigma factor [Acidobacteriota bacterium]